MKLINRGTKSYFIYQNKEIIGKLNSKHPELKLMTKDLFLIRKTRVLYEVIFYIILSSIILSGILLTCFVGPAWIVLSCIASLGGCFVRNPFDLLRKTDYIIYRPVGFINLYDDHHFETNASLFLKERFQFIFIRAFYLVLFLVLVLVTLIVYYLFLSNKALPFLIVISIYVVILFIALVFIIKKLVVSTKKHKITVKQEEKLLADYQMKNR